MMASSGVHRYWPFWVYLFSVAALIGLVVAGPKLVDRQRAIESAAVKREAVARGDVATSIAAESHGSLVPIWPIQAALGVAAIVSGGLSLRHVLVHRVAAKRVDERPTSSPPKTDA